MYPATVLVLYRVGLKNILKNLWSSFSFPDLNSIQYFWDKIKGVNRHLDPQPSDFPPLLSIILEPSSLSNFTNNISTSLGVHVRRIKVIFLLEQRVGQAKDDPTIY
ncbi:hypothetical protein TNCT_138461 [Trichonephila clavata]|uniref:Uncharacterized protein n=1 Tax=Trichonephila clavata TaxID=2740835 RepID=A0A8X6GLH3_TRICU|nr:hypothetical protein TNCT_138461 [Trichonephila clavata]